MSKNYHIAVLPGDGIGPEVMNQAMKVLEAVRHRFDMRITTSQHDVGGVAIDRQGTPLPQTTVEGCEQAGDVAVGLLCLPAIAGVAVDLVELVGGRLLNPHVRAGHAVRSGCARSPRRL